jgi:hypothetical protein
MTKKENILNQVETVIKSIKTGDPVPGNPSLSYENTVSYVDRQYINITPNDVNRRPMAWVIINNEGEDFTPRVGGVFENQILLQIVGFVKANKDIKENLDTKMNSLQGDILRALLSDIQLNQLCSYIMPQNISTVADMIYPYGGFVLTLDITYTFSSVNL